MNLDEAMKSAKDMNELVTVEDHGIEIIRLFGVDLVLILCLIVISIIYNFFRYL